MTNTALEPTSEQLEESVAKALEWGEGRLQDTPELRAELVAEWIEIEKWKAQSQSSSDKTNQIAP